MNDTYFKYPPQDPEEFELLCQFVRSSRIQTLMEIGSRHGRSLIRLAEAAMPTLQRVIVVDLPGSLWGADNSEHALKECAKHLRARGITVDLYLMSSHSREAHALSMRERGNVDFLFINGDHSYKGATNDYLWFGPCVKSGGAVAFHDVCATPELHSQGVPVGVPQLWDEIKTPTDTTIHTAGSKFGIGIKSIVY